MAGIPWPATAALQVLREENLAQNSTERGEQLRKGLRAMVGTTPVLEVRGKGLLNAIVIREENGSDMGKAWDICLTMKEHGLLAKPTHGNIIRFAPLLTISEGWNWGVPLYSTLNHLCGPAVSN